MLTRVLVVEDEPAIRELLAEYLRGRNLEVVVVADAEAAFHQLVVDPPDVVVTDLRLPGSDGVEVVRAAAAHVPPVPAVTMTGFGTVDSAVAAFGAGASDYLLKPFRLRDLFGALERAMLSAARTRASRWAERAVRLLTAAEEVDTIEGAEALIGPLAELLADTPGVDSVRVLDGDIHLGAALGNARRVLVNPDVPAARPYVAAVHRALERVGR
jgi:DNA-binding NtrC family response regulator